MKIFLTRHAQTEENANGIIQGQLPGRLSQIGRIQVQKVAQRLKDWRIDFVYSSDLARAAETAKEIAKYHPNVPLQYDPDLRERNLGEYQGKKTAELGWHNENYVVKDISLKKGETLEALYQRAQKFINKLQKKHPKGRILCSGHEGINRAIIASILDKGPQGIKEVTDQYNTALNVIELTKNQKYKIHKINSIDHLKI